MEIFESVLANMKKAGEPTLEHTFLIGAEMVVRCKQGHVRGKRGNWRWWLDLGLAA